MLQFACSQRCLSLEVEKGNALDPHTNTISIASVFVTRPSSFNATIIGSCLNLHSCLMYFTTDEFSCHGFRTQNHGKRSEKNLKLVLSTRLHSFVDEIGSHITTQSSSVFVCCTRNIVLFCGSRSGVEIKSRTVLPLSSRIPICYTKNGYIFCKKINLFL